jgi:hypothetical protein
MFLLFLFLSVNLINALIRLPIKENTHPSYSLQRRDYLPNIPLYNAKAREYLIEIGIGNPPQKFNLTLDTGR